MENNNETPGLFAASEHNFLNLLQLSNDNIGKCADNGLNSLPFDYMPTNGDFFLPPPEDILHADPQLYSVEQGELQPITSPFMVPGIYRKFDTNVNGDATRKAQSNVFLTESEPHGRIVRASDFHKLYVCDNATTGDCNSKEQPRKVFPIRNVDTEQNSVTEQVESIQTAAMEVETPKKWDALSKLAYNILKMSNSEHSVVINRTRNEIVRTEKNTNQKTIYRFLSDEALGIQPPDANMSHTVPKTDQKSKLGRPKKRNIENLAAHVDTASTKLRLVQSTQTTEATHNEPVAPASEIHMPKLCTRSGRIVKTVRPVPISNTCAREIATENSAEQQRGLIAELKDVDYTCNSKAKPALKFNAQITEHEDELESQPLATSSPTKRHVSPDFICPTCKKVFLGRRLKSHFVKYPDHMVQTPSAPIATNPSPPAIHEDMSLFRFLVSKLHKSNLNEDQRADLFLHELNDLVEQLQLRSSRLVRNTSGLHFVTSRISRVLGIPEGQYALDLAAIDATPEPETPCLVSYDVNPLPLLPSNNTRSLDYTALSLDDTLTDEAAQKLNLSAGGKLLPPSEESLLRAVDDLVPPGGMSKLVVGTNLLSQPVGVTTSTATSSAVETLVPHYDHASDNAVEAVTMKENTCTRQVPPHLDMPVDFFQFNTN